MNSVTCTYGRHPHANAAEARACDEAFLVQEDRRKEGERREAEKKARKPRR